MNRIFFDTYKSLLKDYGPQGWWPLISHQGSNPTKSGSINGYHPNDYSYPKTEEEKFEICIGAILTQNTSWTNVESALLNLKRVCNFDPESILNLSEDRLKEAIKPSGYFNQKARKIIEFSNFYLRLSKKTPTREELLSVWGIGPETADSILLYAYSKPSFVIDAYTRRFLINLKIIEGDETYDTLKELFETNLKNDYRIFQEYHALIVEHAKRNRIKPRTSRDNH